MQKNPHIWRFCFFEGVREVLWRFSHANCHISEGFVLSKGLGKYSEGFDMQTSLIWRFSSFQGVGTVQAAPYDIWPVQRRETIRWKNGRKAARCWLSTVIPWLGVHLDHPGSWILDLGSICLIGWTLQHSHPLAWCALRSSWILDPGSCINLLVFLFDWLLNAHLMAWCALGSS